MSFLTTRTAIRSSFATTASVGTRLITSRIRTGRHREIMHKFTQQTGKPSERESFLVFLIQVGRKDGVTWWLVWTV